MRPTQIRQKLAAAKGDAAEEALAAELVEESRAPGHTLVEQWQGRDEDGADQALRMLVSIDEQAVVALVEGSSADLAPADRVQAMQIAIAGELGLRRRVVAGLEAMLQDTRPLPKKVMLARTEATPPARRVCDEAYLMMRELIHFGEEELGAIVAGDAFLHLPVLERDRAILDARESGTWNRLVTGNPEP